MYHKFSIDAGSLQQFALNGYKNYKPCVFHSCFAQPNSHIPIVFNIHTTAASPRQQNKSHRTTLWQTRPWVKYRLVVQQSQRESCLQILGLAGTNLSHLGAFGAINTTTFTCTLIHENDIWDFTITRVYFIWHHRITLWFPQYGFNGMWRSPYQLKWWSYWRYKLHYNDVIMGTMTSQITSLTIVYSTVYSGWDQRKHQSSASLAFVRGIHWWPVNSPHKGPVTRKMFPIDEVIMRGIVVRYDWCHGTIYRVVELWRWCAFTDPNRTIWYSIAHLNRGDKCLHCR